ncbi:hypothetical protein BCR42DRAFT_407693 [Absidia repens]|uniref:Uncharacterized protein n=1 Tax=Absidia repens TaxID=90262 RepID=A0A1X2ISM9_9FUNG|nr:hypothetical protein BCR42DRAFT_407693 [Absidia repens]
MDHITIFVFYGSHNDSFTLTRNTTWSDLRISIQDQSGLLVTRLYHRNTKGDIETLSCDDDWKTLVHGCNTSWLQLSIDPTRTLDQAWHVNLNTEQDEFGTATHIDTRSQFEKTYFTTQFEFFGRLMDKYNDLIQRDDHIEAMMHQVAIRLTLHQKPTVDLVEIEAQLEKRLGNAGGGTTGTSSAIDHISEHNRVSVDSNGNFNRGLSRSTTLPPSTVSPLYDHIKRTPTAPSYSKHIDKPSISSLPSYKTQQIVKGTILGEWPAYSSLYPAPKSTHSMDETTSPNDLEYSPSLSLLDSNIHYHRQRSPISLYPQLPTLPSQPSEQTTHPIPDGMPLPLISTGIAPRSATTPNAISGRPSSWHCSKSASRHDDNYKPDKRHTMDCRWESTPKRQLYKDQRRALKLQQKELERAIRDLKRQEKLDKKEYRQKLHHQDQVNNETAIRKSSSLSSLSSSVSSIYSASSALNDSCLQQQNRLEITCYMPEISSSTEQQYGDINEKGMGGHQYDYGSDRYPHHQYGIDKTSQDDGGMTLLSGTLDRLSMNEDTELLPHRP